LDVILNVKHSFSVTSGIIHGGIVVRLLKSDLQLLCQNLTSEKHKTEEKSLFKNHKNRFAENKYLRLFTYYLHTTLHVKKGRTPIANM